jgi:hypothetical protein
LNVKMRVPPIPKTLHISAHRLGCVETTKTLS